MERFRYQTWMMVSYPVPVKATQGAEAIVHAIFDGSHDIEELPPLMLVTKYKSKRH